MRGTWLAIIGLAGAACESRDVGTPANGGLSGEVPRAELSLARDPALLMDSAEALIVRDSSVGMVSVDEDGRPRIRTVRAFRLMTFANDRDRFSVFVLTRMSTRKVEQIAQNPLVTLYFNEDHRLTYATLMGRATVHRDPANPRLQSFLDSATVRFFWPQFPRDFVIVEVVPQWVEFIGPGLWNDPATWRPQAVVFEE